MNNPCKQCILQVIEIPVEVEIILIPYFVTASDLLEVVLCVVSVSAFHSFRKQPSMAFVDT